MSIRSGAVLLALSLLIISPAYADETVTPQQSPLAPGRAAGFQDAQTHLNTSKFAFIGAGALGIAAIYLIVGTHYNNFRKSPQSAVTATH